MDREYRAPSRNEHLMTASFHSGCDQAWDIQLTDGAIHTVRGVSGRTTTAGPEGYATLTTKGPPASVWVYAAAALPAPGLLGLTSETIVVHTQTLAAVLAPTPGRVSRTSPARDRALRVFAPVLRTCLRLPTHGAFVTHAQKALRIGRSVDNAHAAVPVVHRL